MSRSAAGVSPHHPTAVLFHRTATLFLLLVVVVGMGPARSAKAQATPASSEPATVVSFAGSDKLIVKNDSALTYPVQYIGVRGPVRSSVHHGGASEFHGPLVLGQRVLLEADGKDEEAGYKLRHVYLEGDRMPLGGQVLAAGWAVAVPYPLDHRHRSLYLEIQEQAMAAQVGLRQPGLLGPVAPWRPAGSGEAGYIAADSRLHGTLDLLHGVPTGQGVLNRLVRMAPTIQLADLGQAAAGAASPLGYRIEINSKVDAKDPKVVAAMLAHEGTHAVDFTTEAMDLTSFSCFEMEQRAFSIEATTWAEFYGPGGKPNPEDAWDRGENQVLSFIQRGDVENFVRRSPAYERLCVGQGLGD
jgi:endonuclease YncB( thermonuclease family)